jgi:TetR/AcrR family transcriptional regulator, transcriptional repressor for nem operon
MGRTSDAKERLMSAVLELIWTGSYGTTTIDLICEKAGVRKGSFYYFYSSKAELTAAALMDDWEKVHKPKLDSFYSPAVEPLERLRLAAEDAVAEQTELAQKHGQVLGCPLFSLGNEISTQEKEVRDVVDRILSTCHRYVESALREAANRGDIQCADPGFMAKAIFLFWEASLAEARIKNDVSPLLNLWPSIQKLLGVPQKLTPSGTPPGHKAA